MAVTWVSIRSCSGLSATVHAPTWSAMRTAYDDIRNGARGRFYTVVDLVNLPEAELRAGRKGRTVEQLTRRDFVILDQLGYLPFAQAGGQLLFHLLSRLYERTLIVVTTHKPRLRRMAVRLRRRQDDHHPARPAHPSLRDRRDRQRELALQEPVLTRCRPRPP